jgi:hypothetical protein
VVMSTALSAGARSMLPRLSALCAFDGGKVGRAGVTELGGVS